MAQMPAIRIVTLWMTAATHSFANTDCTARMVMFREAVVKGQKGARANWYFQFWRTSARSGLTPRFSTRMLVMKIAGWSVTLFLMGSKLWLSGMWHLVVVNLGCSPQHKRRQHRPLTEKRNGKTKPRNFRYSAFALRMTATVGHFFFFHHP